MVRTSKTTTFFGSFPHRDHRSKKGLKQRKYLQMKNPMYFAKRKKRDKRFLKRLRRLISK